MSTVMFARTSGASNRTWIENNWPYRWTPYSGDQTQVTSQGWSAVIYGRNSFKFPIITVVIAVALGVGIVVKSFQLFCRDRACACCDKCRRTASTPQVPLRPVVHQTRFANPYRPSVINSSEQQFHFPRSAFNISSSSNENFSITGEGRYNQPLTSGIGVSSFDRPPNYSVVVLIPKTFPEVHSVQEWDSSPPKYEEKIPGEILESAV